MRRKCLSLHYDTASRGEISERVVEALGVVFYAGSWHLVGWCRMRQAMRNFRLDRIQSWELLEEGFEGHEDFSVVDFLECDLEKEALSEVVIECQGWALERLLSEMPARIIDRVDLPEGGARLRAGAYSIEWLASWLLGLGTGVRAISPDELVAKVVSNAEEISGQYFPRK